MSRGGGVASRAALSLCLSALVIVAEATVLIPEMPDGPEKDWDVLRPWRREDAAIIAAGGTESLSTGTPTPTAWRGRRVLATSWAPVTYEVLSSTRLCTGSPGAEKERRAGGRGGKLSVPPPRPAASEYEGGSAGWAEGDWLRGAGEPGFIRGLTCFCPAGVWW